MKLGRLEIRWLPAIPVYEGKVAAEHVPLNPRDTIVIEVDMGTEPMLVTGIPALSMTVDTDLGPIAFVRMDGEWDHIASR